MVRINLINPSHLADQHLIAEYNEILMLIGYVRKHPSSDLSNIPPKYKLGKGHILFFKNKLGYLKTRFNLLVLEMKKRGFKARKTINLTGFNKCLRNGWEPNELDLKIIKKRLIKKIKLKPCYYRYCGEKMSVKFLIDRINHA